MIQRPDDDQFYCVMLVAPDPNDPRPGEIAPGRGSFASMCDRARRILANKPYVVEIHINHGGNFWHRIER